MKINENLKNLLLAIFFPLFSATIFILFDDFRGKSFFDFLLIIFCIIFFYIIYNLSSTFIEEQKYKGVSKKDLLFISGLILLNVFYVFIIDVLIFSFDLVMKGKELLIMEIVSIFLGSIFLFRLSIKFRYKLILFMSYAFLMFYSILALGLFQACFNGDCI